MNISLDTLLRILTLSLFLVWWFYWHVTEVAADREKPKIKQEGVIENQQMLRRFILRLAEGVMILQILILQILSLPVQSVITQAVGFLFVVVGVALSLSARKTLGVNWAHAYEAQVKKEQELVTSGVYAYIRHPIYSGLCLAFIGGELVAQSYLVAVGMLLLLGGYWQAKHEEKLLAEYFGNKYRAYLKRTKMFIPFLW